MRLVLAVLVASACGGTPAVAVENRGGAARASCALPERLAFEARQHPTVDHAARGRVWSSRRIGIQCSKQRDPLTAAVSMLEDDDVVSYDATAKLADCTVELASTSAGTLGPFTMTID